MTDTGDLLPLRCESMSMSEFLLAFRNPTYPGISRSHRQAQNERKSQIFTIFTKYL